MTPRATQGGLWRGLWNAVWYGDRIEAVWTRTRTYLPGFKSAQERERRDIARLQEQVVKAKFEQLLAQPREELPPEEMSEVDPRLFCYGCGHSAADAPFPGRPSGERPCFFCVRNPERDAWRRDAEARGPLGEKHPANGRWYDGSPAYKVPMDCYRSTDMVHQIAIWFGAKPADHIFG